MGARHEYTEAVAAREIARAVGGRRHDSAHRATRAARSLQSVVHATGTTLGMATFLREDQDASSLSLLRQSPKCSRRWSVVTRVVLGTSRASIAETANSVSSPIG